MKPPFALTLSVDGLLLLHRTAEGWRRVSHVALDEPDLAASMSRLRDAAERLEPDFVLTKIIIPNDQIRYLSLETGDVDNDKRQFLVRDLLDGVTPYRVDDLAYDLRVDGRQTHIAAVARETLAEAEGFAREHGLNPVSFAAIPENVPFSGEPFLGVAAGSAELLPAGETVEPDEDAIIVMDDDPLTDAPPQETGSDAPDEDADIAPEPSQADTPTPEPEPEEPVFRSRNAAEKQAAPAPDVGFASRRAQAERDEETADPLGIGQAKDRPRILRAPRGRTAQAPETVDAVSVPPPAPEIAASFDQPPAEAVSGENAPSPDDEIAIAAAPEQPDGVRIAPVATGPPRDKTDGLMDEAQRMTLFGERSAPPPRRSVAHPGVVLAIAILALLGGAGIWVAMAGEGARLPNIAALWGSGEAEDPEPPVATDTSDRFTATVIEVPEFVAPAEDPTATENEIAGIPLDQAIAQNTTEASPASEDPLELAALPDATEPVPGLSETDTAVLDALRGDDPDFTGAPTQPPVQGPVSQQDLETQYAVTGIWPRAPEAIGAPTAQVLDSVFVPALDPKIDTPDAVALPTPQDLETDTVLASVSSPAAPGTVFDLNAAGLVVATEDGALSPDGHVVFLGQPPVLPPPTPVRFETEPETEEVRNRLAEIRPRARPGDLVEQVERSQLGGLTLSELSDTRPLIRPPSPKDKLEEEQIRTTQAVLASPHPLVRPKVAVARAAATVANPQPQPQQVATVAPRTVTPSIPSTASVARQATIDNAINLRKVNLIGVYGSPSDRRALVRLPSGRYKKVKVGDSVDGGRVLAIGDNELRYRKGSRTVSLKMPRG